MQTKLLKDVVNTLVPNSVLKKYCLDIQLEDGTEQDVLYLENQLLSATTHRGGTKSYLMQEMALNKEHEQQLTEKLNQEHILNVITYAEQEEYIIKTLESVKKSFDIKTYKYNIYSCVVHSLKKKALGIVIKPSKKYLKDIIKLLRQYEEEVNYATISDTTVTNKAQQIIDDDNSFLFMNHDGKITTLLHYTPIENYANIDYLVTKRKYRNKGYAQTLLYYATENILAKLNTPIISVKQGNIYGEKMLDKIGFKIVGYEYHNLVLMKRPKIHHEAKEISEWEVELKEALKPSKKYNIKGKRVVNKGKKYKKRFKQATKYKYEKAIGINPEKDYFHKQKPTHVGKISKYKKKCLAYGFDIRAVWNLDSVIIFDLYGQLCYFRDSLVGYPGGCTFRQWKNCINYSCQILEEYIRYTCGKFIVEEDYSKDFCYPYELNLYDRVNCVMRFLSDYLFHLWI